MHSARSLPTSLPCAIVWTRLALAHMRGPWVSAPWGELTRTATCGFHARMLAPAIGRTRIVPLSDFGCAGMVEGTTVSSRMIQRMPTTSRMNLLDLDSCHPINPFPCRPSVMCPTGTPITLTSSFGGMKSGRPTMAYLGLPGGSRSSRSTDPIDGRSSVATHGRMYLDHRRLSPNLRLICQLLLIGRPPCGSWP